MAKKNVDAGREPSSFPLQVGMLLGILGGIVVALSFEVIKYWPLPVSVAPYFSWREGFVWGAVVGFSFGCILGFLNDDTHFATPGQ